MKKIRNLFFHRKECETGSLSARSCDDIPPFDSDQAFVEKCFKAAVGDTDTVVEGAGDEKGLEWKLRQLEYELTIKIPTYRKANGLQI